MSKNKDKFDTIVTVAVAAIFFAAILYVFLEGQNHSSTSQKQEPSSIENTASIGGPFILTSHLGETITDRSWPDQFLLIFFGFTHCPDVCPTELAKMKMAFEALPQKIQDKIQPLFITIDPARDDQDTLGAYVGLYHDKLVGLTGTQEQIDAVVNAYRVYAQAQAPDENGYYVVDHSAFIYLMQPDGRLSDVFSHSTSVEELVSGIQRQVN